LPREKVIISRLEDVDDVAKLSDPAVADCLKSKFVVKMSQDSF
jgi:hypothetical protein